MELGFDVSRSLLWIILLPLAGAAINGLFGRSASRRLVGIVGVGSVAIAFALALVSFLQLVSMRYTSGIADAEIVCDLYEWFSLTWSSFSGEIHVPIRVRFLMDPLSGMMTLVVTGIGLLIHIYSLGYMSEEKSYARFFSYLNLFMASMLILVLASSLPIMFVGWEGVGLCSYLLIGFWWENPTYAAAGRKAFVMNRIGDFGVLIGMLILARAAHSFEFQSINAAHSALLAPFSLGPIEGSTLATVACLFLFLGCAGKSAQIPLYTWLPDAMAGPTPVSALIHAATMVTSGIYLCCRLSPVFMQSAHAMAIIATIGAFTALLAASIAVVQNDMKKILAYSTVSQLGFMFAAVGVGAFSAAIFHVFTHAFFKACLFLGAGSVMHAVGAHGDADIRKLGGLRHHLPRTHITFLLACMGIAGVPLMSGFFSKDEILLGAAHLASSDSGWLANVGWVVFSILIAAATLTAFYMFRLYFVAFTGTYRSAPADPDGPEPSSLDRSEAHGYAAHPHESPISMTVPLMVLGVGSITAGWLNVDPIAHFFGGHLNLWGAWLEPVVHDYEGGEPWAGYLAMCGGLVATGLGIFQAWSMYVREGGVPAEAAAKSLPGLHRWLVDTLRVNELYDAIIVRPIKGLATGLGHIDAIVVDGVLTRIPTLTVQAMAFAVSRIQTGVVSTYGAVMVVGIALLAWWFTYPHATVDVSIHGDTADFAASRGYGYEYRWDGNADGHYETSWGAQANFQYQYGAEDYQGYVVSVGQPGALTYRWEIDAPVAIPIESMSPYWRDGNHPNDSPNEDRGAPVLHIGDHGALFLRPNGARLDGGSTTFRGNEVPLTPGERVVVGGLPLEVGVMVRSTVQIRNAFGHTITETMNVDIFPASKAQALLEGGGR